MRRPSRRRLAALVAGTVLFAVGAATIVGWQRLETLSATNVSYLAQEKYQENLLLDTYDTLSSVGFFRSTAQRLTRGLATDQARLTALMEWTAESVRPQYAAPSRIVGDNAWELARRGFGQCDQVNHILATLATFAGYDARQLFLWKTPDHLVSPHSVAEVNVNGKWVVVDAWQGVVWEAPDGTLLSADQATPELMDRFGYTQWGMQADWFKNGTEFRTFPYESPQAFAQKVLRKFSSTPAAPPPVITPQTPLVTISPSPLPGVTPSPKPSPAPTQIVASDILVTFDRARRAQLDGDTATAATLYEQLLQETLPTELREATGFWLGEALLQGGDDSRADGAFTAAVIRDPSTPWAPSILQYRAEAEQELGDVAEAMADYAASNTPTSRARLLQLGGQPAPLK